MEQIRKILQQKINGASIRAITATTGMSRNTIRAYLRTIEEKGLSIQAALDLNGPELAKVLFDQGPSPLFNGKHTALEPLLPGYAAELKQRHMTRQLIWEKYREEHPDGYGYTRFCAYLNGYIGQKDVTAIFNHRPAEKLMVDFAGDKLSYTDKSSGEVVGCQVLVATLPYSSYIYVEALPSQKQKHFIQGISNALRYLGGAPQCILCDNLKSAVKKANRYEPSFTDLIEQMALHYQVTFMATRVRKPRDKATVETSVNVVYRRIYGKLIDIQCHDIKELNAAVFQELDELNRRNFKGRDYSRKDAFLQYEQPHLKPLPPEVFEVKKRVSAKIQRNYHIILGQDMHQYSVPYRYVGKQADVVYTNDTVEIYCQHERIAIHVRNYRKHGYSTLPDHMPENHKAIMDQKGWDADHFLREGAKAGKNTNKAIAQVLKSKAFPEQTYNSCLGILRLGKKYGLDRLEAACTLIALGPKVNYGILDNILKNNMDKQLGNAHDKDFKTPAHDNVRGPENFDH